MSMQDVHGLRAQSSVELQPSANKEQALSPTETKSSLVGRKVTFAPRANKTNSVLQERELLSQKEQRPEPKELDGKVTLTHSKEPATTTTAVTESRALIPTLLTPEQAAAVAAMQEEDRAGFAGAGAYIRRCT